MTAEGQYLKGLKSIVDNGVWIENERTGKKCLTHPRIVMEYDVGKNEFPLGTTRQCFWKAAAKEIIGYMLGYNNANDFAWLGTKTWLANANENEAWLSNPHRKGDGDMGQAYRMRPIGFVPVKNRDPNAPLEVRAAYEGEEPDQLLTILDLLKQGIDNRGLIIDMWRPETFDKSCLRPCMYKHQFTLIGDTLYLDSEQRSNDWLLGCRFNMVQCFVLLAIVAHLTGHKAGTVNHRSVNCHIYDDQYEVLMAEGELDRMPFYPPTFHISDELKTFEQLENITPELFDKWFTVKGYASHDPIKYPFAV